MEKTTKKVSWKSLFFGGVEEWSRTRFFKFFCDFWPPFWSSGATKNRKNKAHFVLLCPEGPLDRFGTTLGSILEPFWGHFELIFDGFSKIFSEVSDFV